jgi:hypothetical protein
MEDMGKILIYQNEKGDSKIDVYFENDDVWLTQHSLAQLYQTTPQNITIHIKNIYEDKELSEEATCKEFLQVQIEGTRNVERRKKHYNFQMVLALGYRIRSHVGIHFRNWASGVLTEYSKKGFAMNDERLKNPTAFGEDYFDELLERIAEIRASEKRFYQKIQQIYATSVDYDSNLERTRLFFQTVQNKMHYSVHGYTAAELIIKRADATKPNMGLTSFKGARVRKGDVDIAKNYLNEQELSGLNRIVTMYLDYARDQAERRVPMHMADWEEKLDSFLRFTGREVLANAGKVSAEIAKALAEQQYKIYDANRRVQETDITTLTEDISLLKALKKK